jgi:hypothetical protein
MTDCERIIGQLRERLRLGGSVQISDLIQHLAGCPRCQDAARTLVDALRVGADDPLNCEDAAHLLPEYTLAADPDSQKWEALRLHLAVCPHCAADYLGLRALEQDEQDAPPVALPAGRPRLDFLPHLRSQPQPWRIDELGRLVVALSRAMLDALTPVIPTALAVKTASHAPTGRRLDVGGGSGALGATLTIEGLADDPKQCALVVEVRVPGRAGWPNLAGSEVRAVTKEGQEFVRVTDAFGKATIAPLPRDELADLTLTIVPVT